MTHPNQIISEPFPLANPKEHLREKGQIMACSWVPYLSRVVDVQLTADNKIIYVHEPVSVEELREHYKNSLYTRGTEETDEEWQRTEIDNLAAELVQESWYQGVPADETIYCAACTEERPAHGANQYDEYMLCNRCVGRYELDYARAKVHSAGEWIALGAAYVAAQKAVKTVERVGYVVHRLPDGRFAETRALYIRDDTPYFHEEMRESHWPTGIHPAMFEVYLRADMSELADCEEQIICTDRHKLTMLFAEGPDALIAKYGKRPANRENPPIEKLLGWDED